jgi:hypothetical protein
MKMRKGLIAITTGLLLGGAAFASAQLAQIVNLSPSGTATVVSSNGTVGYAVYQTQVGVFTLETAPPGSIYHQVVDVYYDAVGQKIEAKSATHLVTGDCTRQRRPDPNELIAQDDGKGNVRFVSLLLSSEPTTGQKPVTAQDKVTAMPAYHRSPPTPETPVAERATNLAAR